jgi:hypothetical protein
VVSSKQKLDRRKYSHASVLETLPGLKLAVAEGGIDCETVVLAVCAAATATRASATERVKSIFDSCACVMERTKAAEVLTEELEYD